MKFARIAALLLLVVTGGCDRVRRASAPIGAATELKQLADSGSRAVYQATYRYATAGPLALGITTRMKLVQRPPSSIRTLETSTVGADGKTVTVRSWQAAVRRGNYSCTDYPRLGVRCIRNSLPPATFHSAQLDELFDTPRREGFFSNVSRAGARARIGGQVATCFEGVRSLGGGSMRYELCYTSDGILLRARRTLGGSITPGVDARRDAVAEAVTISRSVSAADLRLPGPATDPRDL